MFESNVKDKHLLLIINALWKWGIWKSDSAADLTSDATVKSWKSRNPQTKERITNAFAKIICAQEGNLWGFSSLGSAAPKLSWFRLLEQGWQLSQAQCAKRGAGSPHMAPLPPDSQLITLTQNLSWWMMTLGSAAEMKQHILITPCHTGSDQPQDENHSESQEWWWQETNHLSERLKSVA